MKLICLSAICALTLTACTTGPSGVRLTREKQHVIAPVAKIQQAAVAPKITAKTEPVFFNGKIYQVSLTPKGQGTAHVRINGMNADQSKAAAELAKSSFHHFSCREKQHATLTTPVYDGSMWVAVGQCV